MKSCGCSCAIHKDEKGVANKHRSSEGARTALKYKISKEDAVSRKER